MILTMYKKLLILAFCAGLVAPARAMDSNLADIQTNSWFTWQSATITAAGAGLGYYAYHKLYSAPKSIALSKDLPVIADNPPQWDWSQIKTDEVTFPKDFGWGTATSAFQIEGDQTAGGRKIKNSWTESQKAKDEGIIAGIAAGHWDRVEEDVQLIKELGMKEYRFSIKWSAIEPEPGVFDEEALNHYIDLIDRLNAENIKPFVMLFHHAWPEWFGQMGDFQKSENKEHFLRFAHHVFERLNAKVDMWMTFNEPAGYCLSAYYMGHYPPYQKNLTTTGHALKNMLDAHAEFYHAAKAKNKACQIGIAKMFVPLDPMPSNNPAKFALSSLICSQFGGMQNNVVLDYFNTGEFSWGFPFYGRVTGSNPLAKRALDFIAVNYYANVMIDGTKQLPLPGRSVSDSGKAEYPEGLLRSIELCAQRLPNVPMWIGENGIADASDTRREEYFKKHLWVVAYALKQGYDIRGYHVWTLLDSFNWKTGYKEKYGLYGVDYENSTLERTLRPGSSNLVNLIKTGSYA